MIRRAKQSDLEGINKLLFQVHKVHSDKRPDIFRPGMKKYTDEELKKLIDDDDRPIYVYTEDDNEEEIAGYAFCIIQITKDDSSLQDRKVLYIDDLCVDEVKRGASIGTKVYDFVIKTAKEEGYDAVTLNVWNANMPAMKFYEKMGLSPLKVTMEQLL